MPSSFPGLLRQDLSPSLQILAISPQSARDSYHCTNPASLRTTTLLPHPSPLPSSHLRLASTATTVFMRFSHQTIPSAILIELPKNPFIQSQFQAPVLPSNAACVSFSSLHYQLIRCASINFLSKSFSYLNQSMASVTEHNPQTRMFIPIPDNPLHLSSSSNNSPFSARSFTLSRFFIIGIHSIPFVAEKIKFKGKIATM